MATLSMKGLINCKEAVLKWLAARDLKERHDNCSLKTTLTLESIACVKLDKETKSFCFKGIAFIFSLSCIINYPIDLA